MFSDNIEQIEKLINMVSESEIEELSVREGDLEITIRKGAKCHHHKVEKEPGMPPMRVSVPPVPSMGIPGYASVMPNPGMPTAGYNMVFPTGYDVQPAFVPGMVQPPVPAPVLQNTNISRAGSATIDSSANTSDVQNMTAAGHETAVAIEGKRVESPLVGTFYAASSPDAEPFVKKGDTVKKGQVLGIVEAMKLMNEIECEFDGIVADILVKNGDMIEYGQPLFVIQ